MWRILQLIILTLLLVCCGNDSRKTNKPLEKKSEAILHPVFANDVANILYNRCTICHRPDAAGPFSLITFNDAKRKAGTIKKVLLENLMPPWPADTNYSRFRDERIITSTEKETLLNWIADKCPSGDSSKLIPLPDYNLRLHQGEKYFEASIKEFFIAGNNKDHFVMMKVPVELKNDTFVSGIEILPGNKKLVHHINGHLISYEEKKKNSMFKGKFSAYTDSSDKKECYELLDLANDDGSYPLLTTSVTNYLPGAETSFYPHGIGGYYLSKKSILLLDNIHYGASPVDTIDNTKFRFYYMNHRPKRPVKDIILGTYGVSEIIPPLVVPKNTVTHHTTQFTLKEKISLLTVNPHMHLLGKKFLAYAVLPEGDTLPLICINHWDFRWQYFYTYKKILVLPSGTTIVAEGTYDNTEDNPLNPFHPPQTISEREGSMRTTDEMFQLIISYIKYQEGDENLSLEMNE